MSKIVSFGEIMLRLNPEGYRRFYQANQMEVSYAGSEANVAVQLALLGHHSVFVSKVPAHEIGQCAVNELRRYGVDVSEMRRGGPRLGVYYVEKGASQRGGKVIYDRADSSMALAREEEFDWERLLQGADGFHFSGITPGLGGEMPRACLEAVKTARRLQIPVSCDLNYRAKLWTPEQAGRVMTELMPYVDLCIANEAEAQDMFGIQASGASGEERCESVARQIAERFGTKEVAVTLLESLSSEEDDWSGLLYREGECRLSRKYQVHIVDRVGCGDCFGAALIHGVQKGWDAGRQIEFAVAAGCLNQTIEFDFNLVTEEEILALAEGKGGDLKR